MVMGGMAGLELWNLCLTEKQSKDVYKRQVLKSLSIQTGLYFNRNKNTINVGFDTKEKGLKILKGKVVEDVYKRQACKYSDSPGCFASREVMI